MDLVSLEIPSTLCTQARQCTKVRLDKFLSGENLKFKSSQLHIFYIAHSELFYTENVLTLMCKLTPQDLI